ncbi:MAG: hypothetical protein JNG43_03900 [Prevotellamassilia sp.]|nr:hypothetical protein [Prevotellamassilia sp.]
MGEQKTLGAKINVTVTIKISWLLFDIMNETFLRGRTIQDKENHKEVASMFASEDEENSEKILRSIKKGFAEVKIELSDYLNEDGTMTDNSHYDGSTDLTLSLTMPSNFNKAATTGVGEAIHDYLKNSAIAEWYMVTNKSDAEQYVALSQKSLVSIQQAVSKRSRPQRPNDSTSDSTSDSTTGGTTGSN